MKHIHGSFPRCLSAIGSGAFGVFPKRFGPAGAGTVAASEHDDTAWGGQ